MSSFNKAAITLDPKLLPHPDKILFAHDKITKKELADYYASVAHLMLPFIRDRFFTTMRFTGGTGSKGFYQKNIGTYFPDWIERQCVKNNNGTKTAYGIANHKETLVYLAYQDMISLNTWLSKRDKIMYPDRMIFDLDPSPTTSFEMVKKWALTFKDELAKRGIITFALLTGSKGIHVIAPLERRYTFDQVHQYAKAFAKTMVKKYPQDLTIELKKEKRGSKLFIDYLRNTYGATSIAPYSVRPLDGAPGSTPVNWPSYAIKDLHHKHILCATFTNGWHTRKTYGQVFLRQKIHSNCLSGAYIPKFLKNASLRGSLPRKLCSKFCGG